LIVIVLIGLFSATVNVVTAELELDTSVDLVECVQCVQLWRAASQRDTKACGRMRKPAKKWHAFMVVAQLPIYHNVRMCKSDTMEMDHE
ncbi:hypothetical protein OSTOST_22686, partial [Ostertagia ostertagi]